MKKGKINLPSNFNAPENYKTDEFYFAVLEPSITEIDYQAVMSSRKNLRKIFSDAKVKKNENNGKFQSHYYILRNGFLCLNTIVYPLPQ